MKNFISVYLYIQCLSAIDINANPILGEHPDIQSAKKKDFPFIVSFSDTPAGLPEHHFCGGTLITNRHVLTARHCFENPRTSDRKRNILFVKATIGSNDVTEHKKYKIASYITYHNWAEENKIDPEKKLLHDIAIVTLAEDVHGAKPAQITTLTDEELIGREGLTAGWGKTNFETKPRFLKKAPLYIISKEWAQNNYKKVNKGLSLAKNHLCTINRPPVGLGGGDSGGPFLVKGKLAGVNGHSSTANINHLNAHSAHLSVNYYRKFIESVANETLEAGSSSERNSKSWWHKLLFGGLTHTHDEDTSGPFGPYGSHF